MKVRNRFRYIYFTYLMMKINISGFVENTVDLIKSSGNYTYSLFTEKIPKPVWGICGLAVAISSAGIYLSRRLEEAEPNEWLLVIRHGKLVKAGVGLKTFAGPADAIVRFPSKVQKVSFYANNVTKEMQGIIITGFAFWTVNREGDGPFKCYKYMQGANANESVQALSESCLRNIIANSTLEDVMRNRDHVRSSMLKDLKNQLTGWGIWIQSVEITEVKISSQRLFNDLQAEFRQQTRLKAEFIELQGNEKLQESRLTSDLKMSEINQTNQTKKLRTKNTEEIKRKNQQEQYETKRNKLQIERIHREKNMKMQEAKNSFEKATERLKNDQKITEERQNFELDMKKEKIDFDRMHDEKTLKKYRIDTTERIYSDLGLKEIKINQFTGSGQSGLGGLLPSLSQS